MRIAFTGNPNSGKTAVFNAVTGAKAKVGNWSGVTVAEAEAPISPDFVARRDDVVGVDLPGAYSMSPFTPEESITSEYVRQARPDVIVNVVDATNLSRSLFFTTQLLELGTPVVIALNKSDIATQDKVTIDVPALSKRLGCPVIRTTAIGSEHSDLRELISMALVAADGHQQAPYRQEDIDLTDKDAVQAADRRRFDFVNAIVRDVEQREHTVSQSTWEDGLDRILTHKVFGLIVFAVIMYAVFAISQVHLGPFIADWLVGWIETFQAWVEELMVNSPPVLTTIIVNGIIGGVGAVVGFLPLVMVMYFLIALLEDLGYMARVSALLDPIFKLVGLSGKSVIPVVISTGCAIPGIMACRTIRDVRERRATAMLTSFIPCGAKIPVIALFSGDFPVVPPGSAGSAISLDCC